MTKILISLVLLLSIFSCKNNTKTNIQSASSNLQATNQYIKDSLDVDTVYSKRINTPDSVILFFRNADDSLGIYVMRLYNGKKNKEDLLADSLKTSFRKIGFIVYSCDKSLCGFKREFNKRHSFELRFGKEIQLITFFEYWFEGERYLSPTRMHLY
ncbi:MAG TPA: hypothetical protein VNM35_02160 [Chitinophagaceae bacterium]|nr:hypothetical protein [Chitinophagaceae bacterium]